MGRCRDEHGVAEDPQGVPKAGGKLRLVAGRCDPTRNLYDWHVGLRGGKVEVVWPVTARGTAYRRPGRHGRGRCPRTPGVFGSRGRGIGPGQDMPIVAGTPIAGPASRPAGCRGGPGHRSPPRPKRAVARIATGARAETAMVPGLPGRRLRG